MYLLSKLVYDLLNCSQDINVEQTCNSLKGRLGSAVLYLVKPLIRYLLLPFYIYNYPVFLGLCFQSENIIDFFK